MWLECCDYPGPLHADDCEKMRRYHESNQWGR